MLNAKENFKKGLTILFIYTLITICLLMATNRIEKLDRKTTNFRNTNSSVSLNLSN